MHCEVEKEVFAKFWAIYRDNIFIKVGTELENFEINFADYCGAKYKGKGILWSKNWFLRLSVSLRIMEYQMANWTMRLRQSITLAKGRNVHMNILYWYRN